MQVERDLLGASADVERGDLQDVEVGAHERCLEDLGVPVEVALHLALQRELCAHARHAGGREGRAPSVVGQQRARRRRKGLRVACGHEQPGLGVDHDLGDAADVARHDRHAARHRFEDGEREVLGAGGVQVEVGRAVVLGHACRFADERHEPHAHPADLGVRRVLTEREQEHVTSFGGACDVRQGGLEGVEALERARLAGTCGREQARASPPGVRAPRAPRSDRRE